jgi:hypothetical protein
MTRLHRRLRKLETMLKDDTGLVSGPRKMQGNSAKCAQQSAGGLSGGVT